MRTDRLLSILMMLQTHEQITASELARERDVSTRTIYRDMDVLSSVGIPVVADRGIGGGWSLLASYRPNLQGLNEAELQTLFLSQSAHLLDDLGLRQISENALIKLLAGLPGVYRQDAEFVRQRIHIDSAGWYRSPEDISCLPILQDAIWQARKLSVLYRRSGGEEAERVVAPYGLVVKGSIWYLVGAVEESIRTYRVSRIQEASILDQHAVRLPDFDLADYWEQSTADFIANLPQYAAQLRVSQSMIPRIKLWRFARIKQIHPADTEGWSKVNVEFETIDEATEYVLGAGPKIEVVAPFELRQRIIELAKQVVAFYEQPTMGKKLSDTPGHE